MGSLRQGVVDGNIVDGSLMAGQSVGLMKDVKPMQEIDTSDSKGACSLVR
ncbi:MAG: hypothetical protein U9N34_09000 [Candidatus Cloacimonadota bacterium]|nr:hypothetical protein [Candidatus Cloacimonadota bacterium]